MSGSTERANSSITCPYCLKTSWHPKDVSEGYCGACHEFTRDKRADEIKATAIHVFPDGRELSAVRQIFNWRLNIGPAGEPTIEDFYCYERMTECIEAVLTWDGEGDPPGHWHRHGASGRRRSWETGTMKEWVA